MVIVVCHVSCWVTITISSGDDITYIPRGAEMPTKNISTPTRSQQKIVIPTLEWSDWGFCVLLASLASFFHTYTYTREKNTRSGGRSICFFSLTRVTEKKRSQQSQHPLDYTIETILLNNVGFALAS